MKKKTPSKKINPKFLLAAVICLVVLFSLYRNPQLSSDNLHFTRADYAQSQDLVQTLKQKEPSDILPDCRSQTLDHGQKTGKVIVLIHGFTNCPKQFESLGQQFYDLGFNVVITRQPYHGNTNRLSEEISKLTKVELAEYTHDAVTLASGLGDEVTVMGLSSGGVMTAWAAQNDPRVDQGVIIAPLFGLGYFDILTTPIANSLAVLPNQFRWWDSDTKERVAGPTHAYPWYSTHALSEIMFLGQRVRSEARQNQPQARKITVVTNASDEAVNLRAVKSLVKDWESKGTEVVHHHFSKDLELLHDMIDEDQVGAKTEIVYSKLIELIEN